ncbi:hypothetical protein A7Q10_04195 [Methylacidiphilum caldifontis]|uniref:Uncharacterized protein n=2 Tax=Methylacidiphilum caldifontis TaxID=2795386 RepID=A0A4Y8PGT3_9BACT|nr:hypothetical protein A7Q10_04195 [Methylacidiphilum caldifontis]
MFRVFILQPSKHIYLLFIFLLLPCFFFFNLNQRAVAAPLKEKMGSLAEKETTKSTEPDRMLLKVQRLRSKAIQKKGICPSNLWVYGKFEAQDSPKDGLIVCLIAGDRTKKIVGSSGMAVGAGIIFWPLIAVPAFFSSQHLDHVIFINHTQCPPIKKNSLLYISPSSPAKVLVNMKTDAGYHLMELELVSPPAVMSMD